MLEKTKKPNQDDIVFWKPILANISRQELEKFEERLGFSLPETYKDFLAYKFFIELNFGHEAEFFRHTPTFMDDYFGNLGARVIKETLNNGLIPFAKETDR